MFRMFLKHIVLLQVLICDVFATYRKVIYVNGKMAGHHVSALVLDVDLIGQYLSYFCRCGNVRQSVWNMEKSCSWSKVVPLHKKGNRWGNPLLLYFS